MYFSKQPFMGKDQNKSLMNNSNGQEEMEQDMNFGSKMGSTPGTRTSNDAGITADFDTGIGGGGSGMRSNSGMRSGSGNNPSSGSVHGSGRGAGAGAGIDLDAGMSPGPGMNPFAPQNISQGMTPGIPQGARTTPGQTIPMQPPRGVGIGVSDEFGRAPQTISEIYFTPGFLKSQIGQKVRVEFLIGSNAPLVDRTGTLQYVGASYIILQPEDSDDLLMCDLYSIKFVTIIR